MMMSLSLRVATLCLGVTVIALLAGCSKNLSTSAGDQTMVPGPPPPKVAEAPPPLPPEPAPVAKPAPPEKVPPPKQEEVAISPPAAPEETRVTEPPLVVAPAPTEAAPAPAEAAPAPAEAAPAPAEAAPAPAEAAPAPEPPLVVAPAPTEAAPAPTPASVSKLADLADVFFDYDRAAIRDDGKAALEADANLLKTENGWKLLISGHCDERGTLAYNLVLGEKRAQAAKRYLSDLGVSVSQIEVVSYGKEKPFCAEHNQDCWQKNRRAHLTLQ